MYFVFVFVHNWTFTIDLIDCNYQHYVESSVEIGSSLIPQD